MLVLSRMVNEKLVAMTSDGPITWVITQVRGNRVRIGIEAPKSVRVYRGELLDEEGRPRPREAA